MEGVKNKCAELHIDLEQLKHLPEDKLPPISDRDKSSIEHIQGLIEDKLNEKQDQLNEITKSFEYYKTEKLYKDYLILSKKTQEEKQFFNVNEHSVLSQVNNYLKNLEDKRDKIGRELDSQIEAYQKDLQKAKDIAFATRLDNYLEQEKTRRRKAAQAAKVLERERKQKEKAEAEKREEEEKARQAEETRRKEKLQPRGEEDFSETEDLLEHSLSEEGENLEEEIRLAAQQEQQRQEAERVKQEQIRLQKEARQKQELEEARIRKAQEEARKRRELEAERIRQEQEEERRRQEAEAERVRQEQEEEKRRQEQEQERLRKEKEAAELQQLLLQQEQAAKLKAQQEAEEREAQRRKAYIEEQERQRLAQEKAEQERQAELVRLAQLQAQIEQKRKQEEEERLERERQRAKDLEKQRQAELEQQAEDQERQRRHLELQQSLDRLGNRFSPQPVGLSPLWGEGPNFDQYFPTSVDPFVIPPRDTGYSEIKNLLQQHIANSEAKQEGDQKLRENFIREVNQLLSALNEQCQTFEVRQELAQTKAAIKARLRDLLGARKSQFLEAIIHYNNIIYELNIDIKQRNTRLALQEVFFQQWLQEIHTCIEQYQSELQEECPISPPVIPPYYRVSQLGTRITKDEYDEEQLMDSIHQTQKPISGDFYQIPTKAIIHPVDTDLDSISEEESIHHRQTKRKVKVSTPIHSESGISDSEIEDSSKPKENTMTEKWSPKLCGLFHGGDEELPDLHLMAFLDSLKYVKITVPIGLNTDCTSIVNKFLMTIRGNARRWISANDIIKDQYTLKDWKDLQDKFTAHFNPHGCTLEERLKAWKELKWEPEKENLEAFIYKFIALADEVKIPQDRERITHLALRVPKPMYMHISQCTTIQEAFRKAKQCVSQGLHIASENNLEIMKAIEEIKAQLDKTGKEDKKDSDKKEKAIPFMAAQDSSKDSTKWVKEMEAMRKEIAKMQKAQLAQVAAIMDKPATPPKDNIVFMTMPTGQNPTFNRFPSRSNNRGGFQGGRFQNQGYQQQGFQNQRFQNTNYQRGRGGNQYQNNRGRGGFNFDRQQNRNPTWNQNNQGNQGNSNWRGRGTNNRGGGGTRNRPNNQNCHYCQKPGHFFRNCFEFQKILQNSGQNNPPRNPVNNPGITMSMMEQFQEMMQQNQGN